MKDKSELKGIGGWLILPAIGVFLGPIYAFGIDIVSFAPYFEYGDFWGAISYVSSTTPNFLIIFWFEALFAIIYDIFLLYLIYLMVKKKSFFPVLYVRLIYITIVYSIIDNIAVYTLMGEDHFTLDAMVIRAIFQTLVSLAIWVPYMKKSVRVKNTFIN